MRLKELSIELRDRIVSRHRSGEGYQKMSAALKVPKNTVACIILKWKKFGTTKTLPRGRPAKLSNRERRAFVREVTKNPMVALEFFCGDGRTFQKDNHLCSTLPSSPLWYSGQMEASVKGTRQPTWSLPKDS
uniref:Sleeping Beauty transposase HTH domain-containing protein n=1 Tax=Oncorhynchus mykiss TaxID=8022 RepID=A0A8K9UD48_ONCMY